MKIGDKIVCIDNNSYHFYCHLTISKVYNILNFIESSNILVEVTDDNNEINSYRADRFILLTKYRQLKLKKIKNIYHEDR